MGFIKNISFKYYKNYFNFNRKIKLLRKPSYILKNENQNIYNKTIFKIYNNKSNFNQDKVFKVFEKNLVDNTIRKFDIENFIYRYLTFFSNLDKYIFIKNYDLLDKNNFIYNKKLSREKKKYLGNWYKNEYLANNFIIDNKKNILSYYKYKDSMKKILKKNDYKFITNKSKIIRKFISNNTENIETKKSYIKEKDRQNYKIIECKQNNIIRDEIIKIFQEENFLTKYSRDLDYEFIFEKIKEMIFEELIFLSAIQV